MYSSHIINNLLLIDTWPIHIEQIINIEINISCDHILVTDLRDRRGIAICISNCHQLSTESSR